MKIINDTGWVKNTATSNERRGIIDYDREIIVDKEPSQSDLDLFLEQESQSKNNPGNTRISLKVNNNKIQLRTTMDSSD